MREAWDFDTHVSNSVSGLYQLRAHSLSIDRVNDRSTLCIVIDMRSPLSGKALLLTEDDRSKGS